MARVRGSGRGSVFAAKDGYGIRWPEDGKRPQKTGFRTRTEARAWFAENVEPRLRKGGPSNGITHDAFCDLFLDRHDGADRTIETLRERLVASRERFGDWTLVELEGAADDVAAWRAGLGEGSRYRLTAAMRQTLNAAVRWRYLTRNPAVEAGRNPQPRKEELLPFTGDEIEAIAIELGPQGALVVFAAETGLRTNEWVALERRDRDGNAVAVQRRASDGLITPYPKTDLSRRRVPRRRRPVGGRATATRLWRRDRRSG